MGTCGRFQDFVSDLGARVRPLVVSKSLWLALRFLLLAVGNYVNRASGRVLIYLLEEVPVHKLYELAKAYSLEEGALAFVRAKGGRVTVPESANAYAVVGLHAGPASVAEGAKLIAATSRRRLRAAAFLGLKVVEAHPLPRAQDRALVTFGECLWYVRLRGSHFSEEGLSSDDVRILRLLARAMADFGPLRTGDAVNLVSAELLVPKSEARRLLQGLVDKGLLEVESGYVLMTERSYLLDVDDGLEG